jgi:hypothetical protein
MSRGNELIQANHLYLIGVVPAATEEKTLLTAVSLILLEKILF